jgi:hypothetical protein
VGRSFTRRQGSPLTPSSNSSESAVTVFWGSLLLIKTIRNSRLSGRTLTRPARHDSRQETTTTSYVSEDGPSGLSCESFWFCLACCLFLASPSFCHLISAHLHDGTSHPVPLCCVPAVISIITKHTTKRPLPCRAASTSLLVPVEEQADTTVTEAEWAPCSAE